MSNETGASNKMHERSDQSSAKLWLLLSANRLLVTAVLGLLVFVSFVLLVSVLEPPLIPQLKSSDPTETLFATMLGAIATVTTLTVTIGQVVLSQENGPLGDQHMRMSNAMDVRTYVGEVIGKPCPVDPSTFLWELVSACEERGRDLRSVASSTSNQQFKEDVDDLATSITGNAEAVKDDLTTQSFGTFDVLAAALNFNYGEKIYEIERITGEYTDVLGEAEHEQLDELKTALSMFAPAREHVKTLYFQWELVNLSRQILYLSVPALVVSGIMVAVVEPASFPYRIFGIEAILLVIAGAFTLTLLPFLLLLSYITRLVTIAKQTLAVEPLILRDSDQ